MNKKICFVMNSMDAGGAERVVALLANSFDNRGYKVSLVVTSNKDSFYKLNEGIKYSKLNLTSEKCSLFKRIQTNILEIIRLVKYFRRENPDVVISFIRNVPTIISAKLANKKVIISERNNPYYDPPNKVWRILRKFFYPLADGIVFQTNNVKNYFSKRIRQKSCVIPNPLNENIPQLSSNPRKNIIVNVGRLAKQKDQKTLILAFNIVNKKFPDYKLIIYGEGPLREELNSLIANLGLKNNVLLYGKEKDIYNKIKDAKVFVLSSIYEGYPNALIEAMALGIPVVSTNCDFGPSEIIKNGINGFLVEVGDYQGLANKILTILENEKLSNEFSGNSYKIRQLLSIDEITNKWESYIMSVIIGKMDRAEVEYD